MCFKMGINKFLTTIKLKHQAKKLSRKKMKDMFLREKDRFDKFSIKIDNLLFDYSKNLIDEKTLKILIELAEHSNLREQIEAMFKGEQINNTEKRAVLHTALRNRSNSAIIVDGENVMPQIKSVLNKMRIFSDKVRSGELKGATGKAIKSIVNIGIGGSDLGPLMAVQALTPFKQENLSFHFVSNIDGTHIAETLKSLNPEETMFIIASKTFTTQETLTNANTAKDWLVKALGESAVCKHFIAISTNAKAVSAFGIDTDNMFGFWDWVGGRYSIWSAIGMPLILSIGMDNFEEFLSGANYIDNHFRNTYFEKNIPVIMALIGIWHNNFCGHHSYAVLPYDQYLSRFPAYLQQLDMESNGKSYHKNGRKVNLSTAPVLFGEPGTNGQHSFYQLIHQGTNIIPCDFIVPALSHNELGEHHNILLSNVLAQAQALMEGKETSEVKAEMKNSGLSEQEINLLSKHKTFAGNRSSNMLVFDKITPFTLGMLIAIYEHKIFVQGVLWDINSFDQMGVELGKKLAGVILPQLKSKETVCEHDVSTNNLINYINNIRKK